MRDALGAVKYFCQTGSVAGSTRRGMDSAKANSFMSGGSFSSETTPSNSPSGDARSVTAEEIIPVRNGLTREETTAFLAKLRRGRDAGFLPTLPDFDLLLEIAECRRGDHES